MNILISQPLSKHKATDSVDDCKNPVSDRRRENPVSG